MSQTHRIKTRILLVIFMSLIGASFLWLLKPQGHLTYKTVNRIRIYGLYQSLIVMRLDIKQFPSAKPGLICLVENACQLEKWDGPYLTMRSLKDYWQQPFVYINDVENKYLKIYSVGPNGIDEDGKGDDIICERVCMTDLLDLGFATDELADGGIYYHRLPKQN